MKTADEILPIIEKMNFATAGKYLRKLAQNKDLHDEVIIEILKTEKRVKVVRTLSGIARKRGFKGLDDLRASTKEATLIEPAKLVFRGEEPNPDNGHGAGDGFGGSDFDDTPRASAEEATHIVTSMDIDHLSLNRDGSVGIGGRYTVVGVDPGHPVEPTDDLKDAVSADAGIPRSVLFNEDEDDTGRVVQGEDIAVAPLTGSIPGAPPRRKVDLKTLGDECNKGPLIRRFAVVAKGSHSCRRCHLTVTTVDGVRTYFGTRKAKSYNREIGAHRVETEQPFCRPCKAKVGKERRAAKKTAAQARRKATS